MDILTGAVSQVVPLSGPVLTYISLLIIPCMIVYVTNNKEPWFPF